MLRFTTIAVIALALTSCVYVVTNPLSAGTSALLQPTCKAIPIADAPPVPDVPILPQQAGLSREQLTARNESILVDKIEELRVYAKTLKSTMDAIQQQQRQCTGESLHR